MNKILHLMTHITNFIKHDVRSPQRNLFFVAPKHSMGPSRPTGNPAATARTNAAAPRLKGFFQRQGVNFMEKHLEKHFIEDWP